MKSVDENSCGLKLIVSISALYILVGELVPKFSLWAFLR